MIKASGFEAAGAGPPAARRVVEFRAGFHEVKGIVTARREDLSIR